MTIPDGQLRWVQDYDSVQAETPPYHLSFNGTFTVCAIGIYPRSEANVYQETLTGTPPEPRCADCLAAIRLQLGLESRREA